MLNESQNSLILIDRLHQLDKIIISADVLLRAIEIDYPMSDDNLTKKDPDHIFTCYPKPY
jgi:hypothetical protein